MSGLLQRLAARAIGTAPAIRPIVGWEGSTAQPERVPRAGVPEVTVASELAIAPRTPAAPDARRAAPSIAAAEAPQEELLRIEHIGPVALDASPPAAAPGATSTPRDAATDTPRSTSLAATSATRAIADIASADALPPDRSAPFVPLLSSRAAACARLAPTQPRAPSPAATPRHSSALSARKDAPSRAAEDVTEVQVTIGRIELTALQEAPRPKREPARAGAPQSLEEYLARRGTERR